MSDDKTDEHTEIINMFLKLQNDQQSVRPKPNSININPMTAFVSLLGIIIILFQFIMGFGMWSIEDRLSRYDDYDARIKQTESALIRFESIPESIEHLATEIQKFSKTISHEEKQLGERLSKLEGEFIVYKIELNRANRVPLLK